jgi:hypothetical protein
MRRCLIYFLLLAGTTIQSIQFCSAQITDYCENLKSPISNVQSGACFEAMMIQTKGFEATCKLMKLMNPKMTEIVFTNNNNVKNTLGNKAYHVKDMDGPYKNIDRVVLEFEKNFVLIISILPFDSTTENKDYAELVVLVLHNGETQLCASGKFLKQKLYNDDNKFLHIVNPDPLEITFNNAKIKPDISFTFSQSYFLSDFTYGEYNFKIN